MFVGLDLGGSRIKAVALSPDGAIGARAQAPTPGTGVKAVLHGMGQLGHTVRGAERVDGVGVALPGVVDMETGQAHFLPNVPGDWAGVAVAGRLAVTLGAPVHLLNDGRAATFGEWCFGAGQGCGDFVLVAVGTGIGGGIVSGGRLLLGSGGHAGEVGHVALQPHGPRCGCGALGCAEAVASGPALVAAATRVVVQGLPTALRAGCGGDLGRLTPRLIAEVAAGGDPAAGELLADLAERLGTLAASLVVVLNPRRVVVGGGVALAGAPLLEGIRATLRARAGWYLAHAPTEVVPAALGEWAGALGAAAWARRGTAGDYSRAP